MEHIVNIFQYLNETYGIQIVIKDFSRCIFKNQYFSALSGFESHSNCFCSYIKSNSFAQMHCVECSNIKLYNKIASNENLWQPFWGVCYGGVKEYVVPIVINHTVYGALIAGEFACDAERKQSSFARLEQKYGFDPGRLELLYAKSVSGRFMPGGKAIPSILQLCANHIAEALDSLSDSEKNTFPKNTRIILNSAITYISAHLKTKILIKDIAAYCHCSESTLSHCFRESMEISIGQYIILKRLSKAKRILADRSGIPIAEVAEKCGFGSTEYFSNFFKQSTGISPAEYRRQCQLKSNENR